MIAKLQLLRNYLKEIYFRFHHAIAIYKKRLFRLAVKTKIHLPEGFCYDETRAVPRGRKAPDGNFYSRSYHLEYEEIPDAMWEEIKNFDTVLRLYFGGDYMITEPQIWRNTGLPKKYSDVDIFSQVWHYDKVVDYRNVQLFTLLGNTTDAHGPLKYDEQPSETRVLSEVSRRNSTTMVANKPVSLTGDRGDSLWFSTGSMPHRAGIPNEGLHRDLMSIAFFPLYTSIGKRITSFETQR